MRKDTEEATCLSMPTWETLEPWARAKIQGELQRILEEEVTELLGRRSHERRAPVDACAGYRNGYGKPRRLALSCGTVEVRRPRVRGLEQRFESRVMPLFVRRSKEVGEVLPELYLHGLASGDFELALRGLLGEGAPLSSASITRLKAKWEVEQEAWCSRRLDDVELVYAWADGIYVKAGLEKEKAALLVVIGATTAGEKQVLALVPGYRESTESWSDLLRNLRDRGLRAPLLLVADGHLGIWSSVDEIWPETAQQRCWNHKLVNVLDKFPKRLRAQAKELLTPIPYAATREEAARLRERFATRFCGSYPDAVVALERDWDRMVTFYDFPKPHWKHLRTTNVIESPFACVRLRTKAGKRYKKVRSATALIWRLLMVAQKRFRRLDAPDLLQALFAGRKYINGQPVNHGKKLAA